MKIHTLTILGLLVACGKPQTAQEAVNQLDKEEKEYIVSTSKAYLNVNELPLCNVERQANLAYISSTKELYHCNENKWTVIQLEQDNDLQAKINDLEQSINETVEEVSEIETQQQNEVLGAETHKVCEGVISNSNSKYTNFKWEVKEYSNESMFVLTEMFNPTTGEYSVNSKLLTYEYSNLTIQLFQWLDEDDQANQFSIETDGTGAETGFFYYEFIDGTVGLQSEQFNTATDCQFL